MMKTKNLIILFSIIFMMTAFNSCDDMLDIEPQLAISDDEVYGDHDGVVNALYGAYDRMAGPQLFAGTSIFHSDLTANSGQVYWAGTFIEYEQMNTKNMDPSDSFIADKWNRAYWTIDLVNNVIEHIDIVDESDRATVEGEARFIRGILYLELVRFFAAPYVAGETNGHPGVPLVITPTAGITEDNYPERATVNDVYEFVTAELKTAKQLLSDYTTSGANDGRATASTSAAFLSRAYMAMGEWELAAEEADFVIENFGGYTALNETPLEAFNNETYTSEDVFMILQNTSSNAGQANDGIGTFFASLDGYGRSDIHVQDMHMDMFDDPDDLRAQITDNDEITVIEDVSDMYYIGVGTRPGNLMSSKWGKYFANINVVRLAEMILTRAEANFRNSSSIGADPIDDVNAIRLRAGAIEFGTIDLDILFEERYRELCFEGRLLDDIRRFQKDVIIPDGPEAGVVLPWNSPRMVLPIPQREIDVNSNLVQNEAYQ